MLAKLNELEMIDSDAETNNFQYFTLENAIVLVWDEL